MNALRRTPIYAATVGAVLALMPLQAAEVSPALKKMPTFCKPSCKLRLKITKTAVYHRCSTVT